MHGTSYMEAIATLPCRLFQLTWLSGKTYYYDVNNFTNVTTQNTPLRDGWGATTDGQHLIVSDGSSNITWLDPNTLKAVKSVAVNDGGKPVPQLNEVSLDLHNMAFNHCSCVKSALQYRMHVSQWVATAYALRVAGSLV